MKSSSTTTPPAPAAQIAYDYNRGAPVAWWKFDECQGGTLHDSSAKIIIPDIWADVRNNCWNFALLQPTAWGNGASGKYNASLSFMEQMMWFWYHQSSSYQTNSSVTTSAFAV